jgi:hypothetical protein
MAVVVLCCLLCGERKFSPRSKRTSSNWTELTFLFGMTSAQKAHKLFFFAPHHFGQYNTMEVLER